MRPRPTYNDENPGGCFMAESKKDRAESGVDRRSFIKGAAAGAAGLVVKPGFDMAQQAEASEAPVGVSSNERPGSDFMVDVIKSLGIEYCAANPGSSFRGL